MDFLQCFNSSNAILMEGALGERLKREYLISPDENIALAGLIYEEAGKKALGELWSQYIEIARSYALPFMATTPTRRANKERVARSGYSSSVIKDNVDFLKEIRDKSGYSNMYIGGLMGCKGDAYKATGILAASDAKDFHSWQASLFKEAGVDFLYAGIMPAISEAIGMAQAMEQTAIPYIISFMIRKNGCLIDGTSIHDAIKIIDANVTHQPVCYMTNCVHPTVLYEALRQQVNQTKTVKNRFRGIQANTSPLPPEELDQSADLKCSDAIFLVNELMELSDFIKVKIYGGCCGTDASHMKEIAQRIKG